MTMRFTVLLLAVISFFLVAGVLPNREGDPAVIFYSPVFIFLLAALACAILVCLFRRRFSFGDLGFILSHGGVVMILAGALAGFLWGTSGRMVLPVFPDHWVSTLERKNRGPVDLPFAAGAAHLEIDYFPPKYDLYEPKETAGPQDGNSDYRLVERLRLDSAGELDIGDRKIAKSELFAEGIWRSHLVLDDGRILQRVEPMARHFEAQLVFRQDGSAVPARSLAVNHPVSFDGWRLYLMSHGRQQGFQYVVISARKDPGRGVVIAGIWAVIIGTAVIGLRPARDAYVIPESKRSPESEPSADGS